MDDTEEYSCRGSGDLNMALIKGPSIMQGGHMKHSQAESRLCTQAALFQDINENTVRKIIFIYLNT